MFRLPPLKALRAFEAAARHESLSKAARELNVTHAAVSTQVKLLEESLGVRLFRRLSSGLAPTPQAMRYYKTVHQAFNQIHQATTDLLDSGAGDPLTVSCLPNMAMHWLLPRLYGFNLRHPDIKVNVLTAPRSLDFDQDAIDMAIWWGEGWPNQISRYLFSAEMVPVCSPGFLASTPLDSPPISCACRGCTCRAPWKTGRSGSSMPASRPGRRPRPARASIRWPSPCARRPKAWAWRWGACR